MKKKVNKLQTEKMNRSSIYEFISFHKWIKSGAGAEPYVNGKCREIMPKGENH
jgi:hypothetical protein